MNGVRLISVVEATTTTMLLKRVSVIADDAVGVIDNDDG